MTIRKVLLVILCSTVIVGASRCAGRGLKYEPDLGFLNSAQANSPEWLLRVDGTACKDMDGGIGACTKRIRSDASPVMSHEARPYAYRIHVRCTSGTGIDFSQDVVADRVWLFELPNSAFSSMRSFTCQGEIFPHDRDQRVSATWQVRFVVVDAQYRSREQVYYDRGHLVLGLHARNVRVCEGGRCRDARRAVIVKADRRALAYSESEMMRFNYYGY